MSRLTLWFALVVSLTAGASTLEAAEVQAPRSLTPTPIEGMVRVETVARGLEYP